MEKMRTTFESTLDSNVGSVYEFASYYVRSIRMVAVELTTVQFRGSLRDAYNSPQEEGSSPSHHRPGLLSCMWRLAVHMASVLIGMIIWMTTATTQSSTLRTRLISWMPSCSSGGT